VYDKKCSSQTGEQEI